jgi:hypothetical protein
VDRSALPLFQEPRLPFCDSAALRFQLSTEQQMGFRMPQKQVRNVAGCGIADTGPIIPLDCRLRNMSPFEPELLYQLDHESLELGFCLLESVGHCQ